MHTVFEAGGLGMQEVRLGCREIATGYGYASSQEAIAHFGLGEVEVVDVEVILPHGNGRISRQNVQVNQRIRLRSMAPEESQ